MQKLYRVVVQGGWRSNTVALEGTSVLYEIRTYGMGKTGFYVPGSTRPTFFVRPRSFFSNERQLVETSVDYTFATIRPVRGQSDKLEAIDTVGAVIGVLQNGITQALEQKSTEIKGRGLIGGVKALMDAAKVLAELARYRELIVQGQPAVRFTIDENKKGVSAEVADRSLVHLDPRLVIALAHRCLTDQQSASSG